MKEQHYKLFQLKFIFSDGEIQDNNQEKQWRTRQAAWKIQGKMLANQHKKSWWNKEAEENTSDDIKKWKKDSDWRKERTVIASLDRLKARKFRNKLTQKRKTWNKKV